MYENYLLLYYTKLLYFFVFCAVLCQLHLHHKLIIDNKIPTINFLGVVFHFMLSVVLNKNDQNHSLQQQNRGKKGSPISLSTFLTAVEIFTVENNHWDICRCSNKKEWTPQNKIKDVWIKKPQNKSRNQNSSIGITSHLTNCSKLD